MKMIPNLHTAMRRIGAGLAFLTVAGSYLYAQQWENVGGVQAVSAEGASFNNLVIDQAGNYYLSYYDTSVEKGSVQKFNGVSWSYAGGSAGITDDIATFNSLSADGLGNVFYTNQIAYPGSGIEVRQFNGTLWSRLPDATNSSANYHASAVSPANVLFTFGSHNSGTVQRLVNGQWEQVGNAGFSGGAMYAEMVIGSNNKVYTCSISGGVKVYENSVNAGASESWTLTGGSIVDAASASEQYTSDIAVDAANNLYVAYVSNAAGGRKLNVKKFDGTSWTQLGTANFSSGTVQHVAIAVTPSGQPYVVASRFEDDDFLRNTVYKYEEALQDWMPLGGDFVSEGEASYNDLAFDKVNNYLVLAYSEDGTKVKRISLQDNSQQCNNTDPGNNPGDTGCVTFTYQGQPVSYTTVRGSDGKIWLQQNLGSSQVASDKADQASYGDLFQWGRWDDGHQLRNSAVASASDENFPSGLAGSSSYIAGETEWWEEFQGGDQWTAANLGEVTPGRGIDPCKAVGPGWQMPTQTEWEGIVSAESINNPASAYSSHLKLPATGNRSSSNGNFSFVGQRGYFWSSDTSTLGAKYLYVGNIIANPSAGAPRGQGAAVRCIKTGPMLGISETVRKENVGIYPNPTKDILYIKTDSIIDGVSLYNMAGQKINIQLTNNQISMNGLPNGNYIIELKLKNGQRLSKKVIKN